MTAQKKTSGHKRPSILDDLYLSDGVTLARDAAAENGCSETLLRSRLKKGMSPDVACLPPAPKPLNAFERGEYERPYLPKAAYRERRLNEMAVLADGRPAWSVARENGIAEKTFLARLRRGWSPDKAATASVRLVNASELADEEKWALENGISLRSYKARIKAGMPPAIAAVKPLR